MGCKWSEVQILSPRPIYLINSSAQGGYLIEPYSSKLLVLHLIKHMSSNQTDWTLIQILGRLAFSLAVLSTIVLVIMGITGTPWPKWLLALTTVL